MGRQIPLYAYRACAHRTFHDEGTIEIDDDAKVSRITPSESTDGAHGAYVQAWVWVYDDNVTPDDCGTEARHRFG